MSDLEAAFLADIKANPHDWLPRLVFADWLEEQGDERAELIRLSHDLTRLQCEDRPQKEARLQELREAGVEWPTPKLENGVGMEFVLIPPGEFLMGSPEDEEGRGDNEGQVEVVLTQGFWLGKYTVTYLAWRKLRGIAEEIGFEDKFFPLTGHSWERATEVCDELTKQELKKGNIPSGYRYSLPTEAQWEFACRSGTTTPYNFGESGNDLKDFGWFRDNTLTSPHSDGWIDLQPVGELKSNCWGLHDMHGNVVEMCRDVYVDQFPGGQDPVVLGSTNTLRTVRRGFCHSPCEDCRSATRRSSDQTDTSEVLGFRVACVPVD